MPFSFPFSTKPAVQSRGFSLRHIVHKTLISLQYSVFLFLSLPLSSLIPVLQKNIVSLAMF